MLVVVLHHVCSIDAYLLHHLGGVEDAGFVVVHPQDHLLEFLDVGQKRLREIRRSLRKRQGRNTSLLEDCHRIELPLSQNYRIIGFLNEVESKEPSLPSSW